MCVIYRTPSTPQGTFGIWFIDGKPFCVTLERPTEGDYPCIPPGTYECERFDSPKNGETWLLKDVPGRTMIEIHSANVYTQLLGCIAPGRRLGELSGVPAVLESKLAMRDLFMKLGDSFVLTIIDAND